MDRDIHSALCMMVAIIYSSSNPRSARLHESSDSIMVYTLLIVCDSHS